MHFLSRYILLYVRTKRFGTADIDGRIRPTSNKWKGLADGIKGRMKCTSQKDDDIWRDVKINEVWKKYCASWNHSEYHK